MKHGVPHPHGHSASGFEVAMRICMWALSMRSIPTWKQIQAQWGVSRATAYRWRAAIMDATGRVE